MQALVTNSTGAFVMYPISSPVAGDGQTVVTLSDADVAALKGPGTRVYDLAQGRIVVAPPAPLTPAQAYAAAVAAGYTVPGISPALVLDMSEEGQSRFTSLLVLIDKAVAAGGMTADTPFPIADKNGVGRVLTVAQIQEVLLNYGEACGNLFQALHSVTGS